MFFVAQLEKAGASLLDALLATLESDEKEAVSGDLQETSEALGTSLLQVFGLVVRRQIRQWCSSQSWLVLCAVTLPVAVLLAQTARGFAGWSAVYSWMLINNTDAALLRSSGFWHEATDSIWAVGKFAVMLFCCSWVCGALITKAASKARYSMTVLFVFASLWVTVAGIPSHVRLLPLHPNDPYFPNGAVFANVIYRDYFPLIVYACCVLVPSLLGVLKQPASNHSKTANFLFGVAVAVVLANLIGQSWLLLEIWSWRIIPARFLHPPNLLPVVVFATAALFFSGLWERKTQGDSAVLIRRYRLDSLSSPNRGTSLAAGFFKAKLSCTCS